jgi:hypothetical protein
VLRNACQKRHFQIPRSLLSYLNRTRRIVKHGEVAGVGAPASSVFLQGKILPPTGLKGLIFDVTDLLEELAMACTSLSNGLYA